MKRLPRILFDAITVLSLILCLATLVLWVRSHYARDAVYRMRDQIVGSNRRLLIDEIRNKEGQLGYYSGEEFVIPFWGADGRVDSAELRFPPADSVPSVFRWVSDGRVPSLQGRRDAAPSLRDTDTPLRWGGQIHFRFVVAHWVLVLAFGAIPGYRGLDRLNEYLRTREPRAGQCPSCGYDLRATPDRCPECGATAKGINT